MSRAYRSTIQALFTVIFVGTIALLPQSAAAGWNGQQMAFLLDGSNTLQSVTIEGINHEGNWAVFTQRFNYSTQRFALNGWWWKGTVRITYGISTGRQSQARTCFKSVPTSQSGDWVNTGYSWWRDCW